MKTNQPYDIIGDIHGQAGELRALLTKLGYVEREGYYRHPERTVIFLGDFIDRGPRIRETLEIVRAMMKAGTALAVMGNHEYNAIAFHTPNGNGRHLRPHSVEKMKQHQATLDQIVTDDPKLWEEYLDWFKTLPLFLDLGDVRIVHASWDEDQIALLNGDNRLSDELLGASAKKGTPEFLAIEVLLKGKEIALPEGHTITIFGGVMRKDMRVKWWLPAAGKTYYEMSLPTCNTAPKLPVPVTKSLERGYAETEPPVFVGHYWLTPEMPELLAPNIACVDYSVAKFGGMLTAYRWDGERALDAAKFVSVSRQDTAVEPAVLEDAPVERSFLGKSFKRARDVILALERAIDDPATSPEMRAEYREELGGVAMGYIDVMTPEEEREYIARLNPRDLLTDAEWKAFDNRKPRAQ